MINNDVFVTGVQQSDSFIPIHVSILLQILFPFRLENKFMVTRARDRLGVWD